MWTQLTDIFNLFVDCPNDWEDSGLLGCHLWVKTERTWAGSKKNCLKVPHMFNFTMEGVSFYYLLHGWDAQAKTSLTAFQKNVAIMSLNVPGMGNIWGTEGAAVLGQCKPYLSCPFPQEHRSSPLQAAIAVSNGQGQKL